MFRLKIFVRVQTFRRVPPVLPCNFCHPAWDKMCPLVQVLLLAHNSSVYVPHIIAIPDPFLYRTTCWTSGLASRSPLNAFAQFDLVRMFLGKFTNSNIPWSLLLSKSKIASMGAISWFSMSLWLLISSHIHQVIWCFRSSANFATFMFFSIKLQTTNYKLQATS